MPTTIPLQIDPAPPAPSRQDPENFDDKGDAFLAFIEEPLVPQMNAMSAQLNAQADAAVESAASAANNATVTSQARADAVAAASSAAGSASSASASATTATNKAAEALASANAASAVQGIPSVAGKALFGLRVNADASGIEWVQDGNALGYAPVQQGTGVNQVAANVIKIGRSTGVNNVLRATIDSTDIGYLPTATGPVTATAITWGKDHIASSFSGAHIGDGSGLTGLTSAQITGALTYTPANSAMFAPAATAEVGRYIDMHALNNTNSYDVRLEAIRATSGGSDTVLPDGTGDLKVTAARLQVTGNVSAGNFLGSGSGLTGLSSNQITTALGFTPVSAATNASYMTGLTQIISGGTNFSAEGQPTLRLVTPALGTSLGESSHLEFSRTGSYTIKVGLDASNNFAVGGGTQGVATYRFFSDPAGNFTALGNITAFSDIRFKTDMRRMENVVGRLLSVEKGGIEYLDTNSGTAKYGVGAQYLAAMFPHAVLTSDKGIMSVAYGQLALAALIEVTREFKTQIDKQQKQIDELLSIINKKEY